MHGTPEAAVTTVIVPAERAPEAVTPGGLLPVRDRRRQLALLPVVCAAPPRAGARRRRAVRVPADRRGPRRGLGGVGARPRRARRDVGRARTSPATTFSTACAPRWAPSGSACPPTAPVGLWGYSGGGLATAWAAEMSGSLCARTQHRRRGARIARRRPRPHVPPAQRHLHVRPARARGRRAGPHLPRPRPGHPGARHRRGQGAAAAAAQDDHRGGGDPDGREGHGRHGRLRRWSRSSTPPRSSTSSTTSSSAPRCRPRRC